MNLYILDRNCFGYDEYDAHLIAALDEDHAKTFIVYADEGLSGWDNCSIQLIGEAADDQEAGIIMSSFNAG